jgi:(1->4)-alpha-D-glucan 1-alpha-D-glucosylmutase
MTTPISNYRIQLHENFNFHQLERIIEYLHELGISTVYASPVTTAIKGSTHGYDVTDPQIISPEIGTEADWERIHVLLQKYEMTWVQDIVPNHMAYASSNLWLADVLEKGKGSRYYKYFDIEPHAPILLNNKLMVPFLGNTLTECLQKGEIRLGFTGEKLVITYYQQEYPVALSSYKWICTVRADAPPSLLKDIEALEQEPCHHGDDPNPAAAFPSPPNPPAVFDEPSIEFIKAQVNYFNDHPSLMQELLDSQHYVLTHSDLAASVINYRRFFTVNSLICLRMEDEEVFSAYHKEIRRWYDKGYIQGLRLDHIDGLAAPQEYIHRLRQTFGEDCYMVAEKILAANEPLPASWQLQGTTGYEFLANVSQLLTDPDGFRQIKSFYLEHIVPDMPEYDKLVFEKKHHYLLTYMGGELDNLVHRAGIPDIDKERFRKALAIFMSSFPLYRLYPETESPADMAALAGPLAAVAADDRALLQDVLADISFRSRLMQFTGPLAAKGIEDTTFYVYNPLIARNEVGDSPSVEGLSTKEFHEKMIVRQKSWPHSMNAGTTHDTKRGEDSRIRLLWLTAVPDEWLAAVRGWQDINRQLIGEVNGQPAPLPNDAWFIYQSLLGGIPPDLVITGEFRQRFHDMLTKALREAKVATSWDAPDEAYEKKCHAFVDAILDTESAFMESFIPFAYRCIKESARYGLSQLLLRLTAPGIPDIYQGAEQGDLSFVDPDNRRPVDYDLRRKLLQQIKEEDKKEGAEKLYTLYKALACRNRHRQVFEAGEYVPVDITGSYLAYARRHEKEWVLVIVPLIRLTGAAGKEPAISLPEGAPATWTDAFTGTTFQADALKDALDNFPVALLTGNVPL